MNMGKSNLSKGIFHKLTIYLLSGKFNHLTVIHTILFSSSQSKYNLWVGNMQVLENEILTQIENTKKKTEGIIEVKTWFLEYLEIFKKIEGGFLEKVCFP